ALVSAESDSLPTRRSSDLGLGEMGLPMAVNALRAGWSVAGFDLDAGALAAARRAGVEEAGSPAEAVRDGLVVVMVRTAAQVEERSEEHTSELQTLAYLVCR